MKKLIRGIIDYHEHVRPKYKDTFARLALGQKPDALFIACSDSRVAANVFASTDPGDLFVIRNVGNLVPPYADASKASFSPAAAIEFAIVHLNVTDIIVCGHSECGAMCALADNSPMEKTPLLAKWLEFARPTLARIKGGENLAPERPLHHQLSMSNVLQQLEHLATYPIVNERLAEKKLALHAWWFEIAEAKVHTYVPEKKSFVVLSRDSVKSS